VCAFSVLGARYPAFGANPVPGIRYQVPGSWCLVLAPDTWMKGQDLDRIPGLCSEKRAHGVCMMQDQDANPGMRVGLGPRCSVLGHGGMRGRGDATFPRPSSRPRAENRRPDTESGTQYRSPVFEKPPMRYA
jgi:hypothetical protein